MKYKNKIASILAGLVIGGCGGTQTVPNQPIHKPTATVTQNLAIHQTDVDRRIAKFHPVIQDEYKQGKFTVDFKETDEKRLNAFYNRKTNQITIECTPKFEDCYTSAVEHEIIHYIDSHLSKEERKKVYTSVEKRIAQPDMEGFRDNLRKIDEIRKQQRTIMGHSPKIVACADMLERIQNVKEFLSLNDNLKKIANENRVDTANMINLDRTADNLKTIINIYQHIVPNCTIENYNLTRKTSISAMEKLVYLHKQISVKGESFELPEVTTLPFDSVNPTDISEIDNLLVNSLLENYSAYANVVNKIYDKVVEREVLKHGVIGTELKDAIHGRYDRDLTKKFEKKVIKYVEDDIKRLNAKGNIFRSMITLSKPSHDNLFREQLAAIGDSLIKHYKGPVRTKPMLLSLDQLTLDALADVTYKGHKIFQEAVKKY